MSHDDYDPLEDLLESNNDSDVRFPQSATQSPSLIGIPVGTEAVVPDATEANMICLRGPCKHYWETVQYFDNMNREMAAGFEPRIRNSFCLLANESTVLTDSLVYECNHWDPQSAAEKADRKQRRENYQKQGAQDGTNDDPDPTD